eukprot:4507513-Pleurochrysis_carterae.AAC.2
MPKFGLRSGSHYQLNTSHIAEKTRRSEKPMSQISGILVSLSATCPALSQITGGQLPNVVIPTEA